MSRIILTCIHNKTIEVSERNRKFHLKSTNKSRLLSLLRSLVPEKILSAKSQLSVAEMLMKAINAPLSTRIQKDAREGVRRFVSEFISSNLGEPHEELERITYCPECYNVEHLRTLYEEYGPAGFNLTVALGSPLPSPYARPSLTPSPVSPPAPPYPPITPPGPSAFVTPPPGPSGFVTPPPGPSGLQPGSGYVTPVRPTGFSGYGPSLGYSGTPYSPVGSGLQPLLQTTPRLPVPRCRRRSIGSSGTNSPKVPRSLYLRMRKLSQKIACHRRHATSRSGNQCVSPGVLRSMEEELQEITNTIKQLCKRSRRGRPHRNSN